MLILTGLPREIFEVNERAKIFVRVNTQKCTADELIDILARQGVEGKKIDGFRTHLNCEQWRSGAS